MRVQGEAHAHQHHIQTRQAGTQRRRVYEIPAKKSRKPIFIGTCITIVLAGVIGFFITTTTQKTATPENETNLLATTGEQEETPAIATDVIMTPGGSVDTYVLVGEDYIESGCHAIDPDAKTKNITSSITISGQVDTKIPGDYQITYTATTEKNEQATLKRNVHVVSAFDEPATNIPVLMYHYVYTAAEPPAEINSNYILDTDFEEQLKYFTSNSYYYPSFQELRAFVDGSHTLPAKSVMLTFDDGEWGFLSYGIPLLKKYKVPATSFIITSDADIADKIYGCANPYVSFQSHSYELHKGGGGAGLGGRIHALSTAEILEDVVQAQNLLGTKEAFAYPFGDHNENGYAAMEQANVLCAVTTANDRVRPGDNPYALSRVRISGFTSLDGFIWSVSPNG